MHNKRQCWILGFLLLIFAWTSSCGEPIPVDCATEEECTTENEGGFQTGTVAGIAAGGAAVAVLAGGGLSSDDGGSSGSGSSTTNNNGSSSNTGPILTGTLIDSAVAGVSYSASSGLSGLTSSDGEFEYRSGDGVTFTIGGVTLGTATGAPQLTPVDLVGASDTADRRVINLTRLLQTLDADSDPTNSITIPASTRAVLSGRSLSFDLETGTFETLTNTVLQNVGLSRTLVNAAEAVAHLHGSLAELGRYDHIGNENILALLYPEPAVVACVFNGDFVDDGDTITAYLSSSVPFGNTCVSQTRTCSDGILSGSYSFDACSVGAAASCSFNGATVSHGQSVTAYQSESVAFGSTCTSQTRTCSDGILSGSYSFSNCSVLSLDLPMLSITLEEAEPLDCSFDGSSVEHGDFVTAYLSDSVEAGSSCSAQVRTCFDGTLSGIYLYSTCSVAEAKSCNFNGASIADGGTITAYLSSSVPFGNTCVSQTRTCSDGTLSGSYAFDACSVGAAASCSFNGATVSHGQSVTAYQSESVAFGSTCTSQTRTCSDGSLSGSYAFDACSVGAAASCSFNGQTIAHGATVTAYESENAIIACNSQTRTCSDGTLSGSYAFESCSESSASLEWIRQLGTSSDDWGRRIAVDSAGNVYVTGYTNGSLDGNSNAGDYDVFVVKYSSAGEQQWTRQLGSSSRDYVEGIGVDSAGNVYVTGYTDGSLDGNSSAGEWDLFVVKYSSAGERQWTRQLGTSSLDSGWGIAVDSAGNVYVTGYTQGALDGNSSAGGRDLFVVKYSSAGVRQWTRQLGSSSDDRGYGIAVDSTGNVYVTGHTYGALDGNSNAGSYDVFVVKYSSAGERQWTRQLGSPYGDGVWGIAVDSAGNVYVTGYTDGSLDGNSNAGDLDVFVVKYSSAGEKQWTRQLGTSSEDYGRGIAVDSAGNVYVTGTTYGALDGNSNAGNSDVFVLKYSSSGEQQWTRQLGTSSSDYGSGIALDSAGNVYVTGTTYGALDGNSNAGSSDVFVLKMSP